MMIRVVASAAVAACGVNAAMAQASYTVDRAGLESFNLSMDGNTIGNALAGSMAFN